MGFVVTLEQHVDECIRVFANRLQEFCKAGAAVDLVQWFKCYAADAVGIFTYGQHFGYLDHGEDIEGMFETVQAKITYGTIIGTYHWLHPLIFAVTELGSKLGILDGNARASVGRYAMSRLMERNQARSKEMSPKINDQLDKSLACQEEHPDTLTDFHILDALSGNPVAGSDPTAITLCAIFYHIHKQPHSLAKLGQELDHASSPITYKETLALPYLQAVISETLRFRPAVGLPLWRTVPFSGLEVDGKSIPPGANVGANAWVLHRDTSIFGPGADVFRPERWIEASKEQLLTMNRHDLAFAEGSRTCLGKNLTLIEMAKVVVELLRKFEFEFDNVRQSEWETTNLWFVQPEELWMKTRELGVKRTPKLLPVLIFPSFVLSCLVIGKWQAVRKACMFTEISREEADKESCLI